MTMLMEPTSSAREVASAKLIGAEVVLVEPTIQPARHVVLILDPSRMREVHRALAVRLRAAGIHVTLVRGRAQQPLSAPIDLLFELERLVYRLRGPRLSDRMEAERSMEELSSDQTPDLVFDLCGDESVAPRGRNIRLTFDGVSGESALIGALVAGRMPAIELVDVRSGAVVSRAVACADNAATISEAMDCVLARIVTLVVAAARGVTSRAAERGAQPQAARLQKTVTLELKSLAHAVIRRLYTLCFHTPHWRTCWRRLDGPDLLVDPIARRDVLECHA